MKLIDFRKSIRLIGMAFLTSAVLAEPAQLPEEVVEKLSSDKYGEREKAYSDMHQWAVKNLSESPEILFRAWRSSKDPETRTRCYTLMKEMVVQRQFGKGKGFVGIRMEEVILPAKQGAAGRTAVRVSLVLPDTPAAKAGLKVGDVIVGVDELDFSEIPQAPQVPQVPQVGGARFGRVLGMESVLKFSDYVQAKQPDDVITLHLMRAGKMSDMKIALMKRPASADVDAFGGMHRNNTELEGQRFFKKWLKEKGE